MAVDPAEINLVLRLKEPGEVQLAHSFGAPGKLSFASALMGCHKKSRLARHKTGFAAVCFGRLRHESNDSDDSQEKAILKDENGSDIEGFVIEGHRGQRSSGTLAAIAVS
jgi:hypothetical protein